MNSQVLRQNIIKRYKGQCQKCFSTSNLEIHHIVPRKKGGLDSIQNLTLLCRKCHNKVEHPPRENMKKLTCNISKKIMKDIKHKAIEENTSVNALIIQALKELMNKK